MALSPVGMGAHATLTLHAPYIGGVSPNNYLSVSGCGKVSTDKQWVFKLTTGAGGTDSVGSANACKHSLYGVGGTSSAYLDGGIQVVVPVKMPRGALSLAANDALSWATSIKAADGSKTGACTSNLFTYHDVSTTWEWNPVTYNYSGYNYTYFSSYNDTYQYSYGTQTYNYSYGSGATPSPFNFNNSSAYYHDVSTSQYGGCTASASTSVNLNIQLVDETTGTSFTSNNSSEPGYQRYCYGSYCYAYDTPMSANAVVENYTDWYCYNDVSWNGLVGSWSNFSGCYSYNKTLEAFTQVFTPGTLSSSCGYTEPYVCTFYNATGAASWTNTGGNSNTWWFNNTYNPHDKYAVMVTVYNYNSAYQSWAHGVASWNSNMLTLGHGFRLTSIVVT